MGERGKTNAFNAFNISAEEASASVLEVLVILGDTNGRSRGIKKKMLARSSAAEAGTGSCCLTHLDQLHLDP